jgi:hypothetical protein
MLTPQSSPPAKMQNEQVPAYAGNGGIQQPPEAFINDKSPAVNGQGQPFYAHQPQQSPQNNFPNAIPLASLQEAPAPIDCPICKVRQMTVVNDETGGYTQYVPIPVILLSVMPA